MKTSSKIFALVLSVIMLTALLSACSGNSVPSSAPPASSPSSKPADADETDEPTGIYPLVFDDSVTLTIWRDLPPTVTAVTSDLGDGNNVAYREIMKATGVKVNFTHPPSAMVGEQFSLTVASGSWPDIFMCTQVYTGGYDKGVEDGFYYAIQDIIEEFCPAYMGWIAKNPANYKEIRTDNGNIVGLAQIYSELQIPWYGMQIRQDWLDDLGMERPVTYNEWKTVLTAFRDTKTFNGAGPFALNKTGLSSGNTLCGDFMVFGGGNSGKEYYALMDGKFVNTLTYQDGAGLKEYLTMMNSWYTGGLIDADFVTTSGSSYSPDTARISKNETGAGIFMYLLAGDYFSSSGICEDGAYWTLCNWAKKEKDTATKLGTNNANASPVTTAVSAITTQCDDITIVLRFLDFMFTEEGFILTNYGVEGETFYYDSDNIPRHMDIIAKNPDGMNTSTAQTVYLINNNVIFDVAREYNTLNEAGQEAFVMWDGFGIYNTYGSLSYSPEEGAERSAILNDISTFVEENVVKFIMGIESFGKYDAFIAQLHNMGIDRVDEITNAAYARYLAR